MKHAIPITTTIFILLLSSLLFAGRKGMVTIMSDPAEAKVWIDDNFVGTTPIREHQLSPGHHSVRLLDEVSQITRTESVKVSSDSVSILNIALERQFGGLKVMTNPPGAEVVITSRIGVTPLDDDRIIPGAYTIEIHPAGKRHGTLKKDIIISPNATIELTEELPRQRRLNGLQIGLRVGLGTLAGTLYSLSIYQYNKNNDASKGLFIGGALSLISLVTVSIVF